MLNSRSSATDQAEEVPGIRIVRRRERRAVPWANGQGSTAEIAVRRCADDGPIRWRLSVAALSGTSAFSPLPGLDRVFTVVGGAGVMLDFDGESVRVPPLSPLRFDGGGPPSCAVVGEAAEAFNVMVDPASASARVLVERYETGGAVDRARLRATATTAVLVVAGSLVIGPGARLEPGDVALFDAAVDVLTAAVGTCAVWVGIGDADAGIGRH